MAKLVNKSVLSLLLQIIIIVNRPASACTSSWLLRKGPFLPLRVTSTEAPATQAITKLTTNYSGPTTPPLSFGHCGHSQYVNNGEDPSSNGSSTLSSANARAIGRFGIVGGTDAQPNEFPWQAFLSIRSDKIGANYLCGGSLISSSWVVTAAHCCTLAATPSYITVNLGGNNLLGDFVVKTKAVQFVLHPNYNTITQDSDICLIQISPVTFTSWAVQPICLPESCESTCQPGEFAVVTGWGMTSDGGSLSATLKRGLVPITPPSVCLAKFNWASNNQVCAGYQDGGTDTCQGDSGGPLSCLKGEKYTLDGVTSYGSGCGQPNSPGVYTRVCRYIGWMTSVTSSTS